MSFSNATAAASTQSDSGFAGSYAFNSYTFGFTLLAAFTIVQYVQARKRDVKVPALPPSGLFSSYRGAIQYVKDARSLVREGVRKYKMNTFKVPTLDRWMVIVNTPELIEEIQKAPEHVLSFEAATDESLAVPWTLGENITTVPYHIPIIRSQLTRSLAGLFKDVTNEIETAFEEIVPATEDWTPVPAYDTVMKIVGRTSNRIFVGLPLCRDPDYLDLNVSFTIDVVTKGQIINMVPQFMKPIVGNLIKTTDRAIKRGIRHLQPVIEYRLKAFAEYGKNWSDKPNDLLQWLIDDAPEEERTVAQLTRRILTVNFAAIHTSSTSFTHALFHLAARPEYIQPIREEVERVIAEEGWTKPSMTKMRKLDSFMKESQRYTGIGMLSMTRKALIDYTLSDGTFLPAGTFVSVNADVVHFSDTNYADAHEFDGFRFCREDDEKAASTAAAGVAVSEGSVKHHMVTTSVDYVPFGHGKHACPGRFFAANELKAMMAYVVMHYDIRAEEEGVRPKDLNIAASIAPNPKAKVLFRKRRPSPTTSA